LLSRLSYKTVGKVWIIFEVARMRKCRKVHIISIIVGVLGSIFTEGGFASIFNSSILKDYVIFYHTTTSCNGVIVQFENLFAVF